MAKPPGLIDFPEELKIPYGPYRASVARVIDGDTVVCCLDFGAERYPHLAIRVFGINAPESWEEGGEAATRQLEKLLPRDTPCVVYSRAWSFGRIVGAIEIEGGRDVGGAMVASGHATWREGDR